MTFTLLDRRNKEVWVCFPSSGGVCDLALIWNWNYNTWTIRDLPNVQTGASSTSSPTYFQDLWDYGDALQWNEEDVQHWALASGATSLAAEAIIMSPPDTTGILLVDDSVLFNAATITGTVEKTSCDFIGLAQDGKPASDFNQWKLVLAIHPMVDALDGTVLAVAVGSQDNPRDTPTWGSSQNFIVGTDQKLDFYVTGKHYAIRFTCTSEFKLLGYSIDVTALGQL
jgi:hypothetical protein